MDGSSQEPPTPQMPSPRRQSLGAAISIIVIVLMVVVGAFYAWGRRIAQNHQYQPVDTSTTQ